MNNKYKAEKHPLIVSERFYTTTMNAWIKRTQETENLIISYYGLFLPNDSLRKTNIFSSLRVCIKKSFYSSKWSLEGNMRHPHWRRSIGRIKINRLSNQWSFSQIMFWWSKTSKDIVSYPDLSQLSVFNNQFSDQLFFISTDFRSIN